MRYLKNIALLTAMPVAALPMAAVAGEITWWAPEFGAERAAELVQRFEESHPDITVNLERVVTNGLQNRILIALQSGNTPDIMDVANGWNVPFAATGGLMALDDVVAEQNINLDDFLSAALDTATYEGTLYGLPFRAEAHAIIYNRGAYEEAGLDPDNPPQTWDELVEVSEQLTTDGQYGFGIAGGGEVSNTIFRSLPFIWMNGGSILSEDMTQSNLDSPESIEAVEFYTGLLTEHEVAPPSTLENDGTALRRLFIAGSVAQYQSGQFDLVSIHEENPDLEVGTALIPHPEGKDTASILGGWNFAIPEAAPNKEDAVTFLTWLAQPEIMGFYTDTFPARQSAMDMERFQNPELNAFREMLQYARPQPPSEDWVQITQIYFNYIQEILLGGMSAEEAMMAADSQIESIIAN